MVMNYQIRLNNEAKTLSSNDSAHKINVPELLRNDYDYLYHAIEEDVYELRFTKSDMFKELTCYEKVVGFAAYTFNGRQQILTDIYILKGYRRNSLLFNELKNQLSQGNNLTIFQPTRQVIEALLKYNYAKKVTDSLVVSAIYFSIDLSQTLTLNDNMEDNGHRQLFLTNIYDLEICATLYLKIFNKNQYEVDYTDSYPDDKRFGCDDNRKRIDDAYFDNVVESIIQRDNEIERWIFLLKHKLPTKDVDTKQIIGTTSQLSQKLLDAIDDGIITSREAKRIQNQLFLELRTGNVVDESLDLRLDYLIENIHTKIVKNNRTRNYCKYCFEDVDYIENYCINCGYTLYNIKEVKEEDFVYKQLLKEKRSYKYSLKAIKEKKNYFSTEYSIKASIFTILNYIKKQRYDEEIFEEISNQYSIPDVNLREIMCKKGLITYSMNAEKWFYESENFKISELKAILKKYNKKISGNKPDLIDRIENEIPLEEITSDFPSITQKGIEFEDEHYDLIFHNVFLKNYIYEEYQEFVDDYKSKKSGGILSIAFLDKHISVAIENSNQDQLTDSLMLKSLLYYNWNMYDDLLKVEMQLFLYNLNLCYVDSLYYRYYKPINEHTYNFFKNSNEFFTNEEIAGSIQETYESFEIPLKVSFYETISYLQNILYQRTLNKLNKDIMHKYYGIRDYGIKYPKGRDDKFHRTTLDSYFK